VTCSARYGAQCGAPGDVMHDVVHDVVHGVVHGVVLAVVHAVVHAVVYRVDHRAKVEVVLLPFVAPAYLPKDGEEVGRFVWVLAVYREVCGALELVLARRPAVGRERFYARERDRLPVDDSIHPRHLARQVARQVTRQRGGIRSAGWNAEGPPR